MRNARIRLKAGLALPACMLLAASLQAGGEVTLPPTPTPTPAPAPAQIGALPVQYQESFCYSSYVRRSYVPGFTPQPSTLFENPRTYPDALCVIATPYHQYGGIPGWFFGSPMGYLSSDPPESHALAYERGELGITSHLAHGYPEGKRVIEPIIKPYQGYSRPGGVLIPANPQPLAVATSLPAPGQDSSTPGPEKQLEK